MQKAPEQRGLSQSAAQAGQQAVLERLAAMQRRCDRDARFAFQAFLANEFVQVLGLIRRRRRQSRSPLRCFCPLVLAHLRRSAKAVLSIFTGILTYFR